MARKKGGTEATRSGPGDEPGPTMDSPTKDGPATDRPTKKNIQLRVRDFKIPLVRDAVVVGTEAPIGPQAMHRALDLMNGRPFERIEVDDETIAAVLVRQEILNRISQEELRQVVVQSIKGIMDRHEVLIEEVDAELVLEVQR
jgi:hypothetical protein